MFNNEDVAEYYNTTQNHYERWWNLKKSLSLHYGIWDEKTKNFNEALINTNRILMELAEIKDTDQVLDAGCGVGGAALFVHQQKKCKVVGITLSQKQIQFAKKATKEKGLENQVSFFQKDYTNTGFEAESFDVIWACESHTSGSEKALFFQEAYRLLRKGGRLVISDYFMPEDVKNDKAKLELLNNWLECWSMPMIETEKAFCDKAKKIGFHLSSNIDYTEKIRKSSKRMYYSGWLAAMPSKVYNFFNPKVSRFAKTHYKSGIYQYQALKKDCWQYRALLFRK